MFLTEYDLDHLYKFSFSLPMDAQHKIWLSFTKQFWRRNSFKKRATTTTPTDGRTPEDRVIS